MTHTRGSRLVVFLLLLLALPLTAAAQPTRFGYRVTIPRGALLLESLGAKRSSDTVPLMWDYGPRQANPNLPAGKTVSRTDEIGDSMRVTYPYTLPAADSLDAEPSIARAFPG